MPKRKTDLISKPTVPQGQTTIFDFLSEGTPEDAPFRATPFRYVSLFSGIGGFEQALNRLGGQCVMASDIDKFANQSYEALYGAPTAGDIMAVPTEDIPDHDVLVGGFPCQAFSVAGNRRGFEDTRGTLFFEFVRIAKDKRPKALLIENVKGLISHDKGRTLDTMFIALNQIGYTVDFEVLNSKFFGVPQNRERIFIVAIRDDLITPEPWVIDGTNVVAKGKRRIAEFPDVKTFNFAYPAQNEVTTRLKDVLETNVDAKYYLSEEKTAALVAQLEAQELAQTDGLPIKEATKKGYAIAGDGDAVNCKFVNSKTRRGRVGKQIAQTLEANGEPQGVVEVRPVLTPDRITKRQNGRRFKEDGEESFTLTAQDRHGVVIREVNPTDPTTAPRIVGMANINGHDILKRVYDPDHVGPTLTTMGGGNTEPKIVERTILDTKPKDAFRVYDDVCPTLQASDYKEPKQVIEKESGKAEQSRAEQFSEGEGIAYCVDASYAKGLAPGDVGSGRRTHIINETRYRIRKLTPLECWRLQGFADSEFLKARDAGVSDSQLYKQAGNAVTVNVIDAIARPLLSLLYGNQGGEQAE